MLANQNQSPTLLWCEHIHGIGPVARGVGEMVVAVLAQIADMERQKIIERTEAGRAVAVASLGRYWQDSQGQRQHGSASEGRQGGRTGLACEAGASIRLIAEHFQLSEATVKRYVSKAKATEANLK